MIKIEAKIIVYKRDTGRKTPFKNGYRPLFNFLNNVKTSGQISLLDRDHFYPGDEAIVVVSFLNKEFLGSDFKKGKKFTFDEGAQTIGEGEILRIIES